MRTQLAPRLGIAAASLTAVAAVAGCSGISVDSAEVRASAGPSRSSAEGSVTCRDLPTLIDQLGLDVPVGASVRQISWSCDRLSQGESGLARIDTTPHGWRLLTTQARQQTKAPVATPENPPKVPTKPHWAPLVQVQLKGKAAGRWQVEIFEFDSHDGGYLEFFKW